MWNDSSVAPSLYGYVSYRHGGKAATMRMDGHAATANYEELDDMTVWADKATERAWTIDQK